MNIYRSEELSRKTEILSMLEQKKGYVPVELSIEQDQRRRYLVPGDLSIGQILPFFKTKSSTPSESLICFVGNHHLPAITDCISVLYQHHQDDSAILQVKLMKENAFG